MANKGEIKYQMDREYLPSTTIELEKWMIDNCYNFNSYAINGNSIYEGYGIDKSGGRYLWYFTERGRQDNLKYFETENEIVAYAFNQIKADKWAKTHCIGFSTDLNKINNLKTKLQNMEIVYIEDEIPYYGLDKPVYRIFVLGCDIRKAGFLK